MAKMYSLISTPTKKLDDRPLPSCSDAYLAAKQKDLEE